MLIKDGSMGWTSSPRSGCLALWKRYKIMEGFAAVG